MHPLILLHGSTKPLGETVRLRAGKLNMVYEAGFLRHIKIGDTEVLRMINHYIRDQNWETIPMTITNEKIDRDALRFSIVYKALCQQRDIKFQWNCHILGDEDSSIRFEIEGEALHTFKRNRLGFTVLHPMETCSGRDCLIIHSDKKRQLLRFREFIDPYQPFVDVTGMEWKPAKGMEAVLHFEGDVFETEDQRNWMDASYKTYCTPLSKPFPVIVTKGDLISQSIHFNVRAESTIPAQDKKQLTITVDKSKTSPFPQVGLPLSKLAHDKQTLQWIKNLNIDFLRIELNSNEQAISFRIKDALETGLPLELVLFFEREFNPGFMHSLLPLQDRIKQIIVLPAYANGTDKALIEMVVPWLRKNFPRCKIGGGTDAFFTELNREKTPVSALDFLSFSVNPQVHASDISTMTENLATLKDLVTSCRMLTGGKEIHVGPVTFKMRWNPGAITKGAEKSAPGIMPASADSRQLSLFGAAWTLGSFKHLAESNVSTITYYETCGWKGLMLHPEQTWPTDFLIPQNAVYPLYIILREILRQKHSRVARLMSNDPLTVDGLALVDRDGTVTIMLANYTPYGQSVFLPGDFKFSNYCSLNSANAVDLMRNPEGLKCMPAEMEGSILLPPFSFTVLN